MSKGSPASQLLREAIVLAAEAVGSDGNGRDGLMGYLVQAAQNQPKSFLALLGRIIPLQVAGPAEAEGDKVYRTLEELRAAFAERGLPVPTLFLEAVKVGNGHDTDSPSYQ